MLYFVAIVFPPLSVLLCKRPGTAILNCFLTLFFWVPGAIHAILIVNEHKADERAKRYGVTC